MALPLLALGRAALGAARTGVTASRTAKGGKMGFKDMMELKNTTGKVIDFRTGKTAENTQNMSSGGGASPIVATPNPTAPANVSSDIQAASELSMEELATQTKILRDIQENTQQTSTNTQGMLGSGAAAAIPSTPDEKQDSSDDKGLGEKILGKLAAMAPAASVGLGSLAGFGLAQIGTGKPEDKRQEQIYDVTEADAGFLDRIGANTALSDMFGTRRGMENVSSEELEANQGKREQIVKRIERADLGEDDTAAQIKLLDRYFKTGQAQKVEDMSKKFRMVGDEESLAYQYRFGNMNLSQAEDYADSSGASLALDDLKTARTGGNAETIAEAEQKFVNLMNEKRLEFDKMYSTGVDKLGQAGIRTGKEKASDQLNRVDDAVASKFGNEGFFGGLMESGKRLFSSEDTDQEGLEKGVRGKLGRIRAKLTAGGANEKQIQTQISDELQSIKQMDVDELNSYIKTDEMSTDKLMKEYNDGEQEMNRQRAQEMAAMTAAGQTAPAAGGGQASKEQEPVVATAVVTDPTTRDSVGNGLKKINNPFGMFGF